MANPSKQRGTAWETALLNLFRGKYELDADKVHLSGTDDQGDLVVREKGGDVLIVEAKSTARLDAAGFVSQAITERDNYCKARGIDPNKGFPIVIWKRRNKPADQAYVITTVAEFFGDEVSE